MQRHGRYRGMLGPGLHLRWPPPFERVTRLAPGRVRSLEIGFRTGGPAGETPSRCAGRRRTGATSSARAEDEALLLTGDGQLVELSATAQYRLDAARPEALRAYAFAIADADAALRPLAESAVRDVAARRPLDAPADRAPARGRAGRRRAAPAAGRRLRARPGHRPASPSRTSTRRWRSSTPIATSRGPRATGSGGSTRGRPYRAEALAAARGRAAATVNRAEADRAGRGRPRLGRGRRLRAQRSARAPFPGLTDHRLYWETIAVGPGRRSRRSCSTPTRRGTGT